jgi:hypothetical protein
MPTRLFGTYTMAEYTKPSAAMAIRTSSTFANVNRLVRNASMGHLARIADDDRKRVVEG